MNRQNENITPSGLTGKNDWSDRDFSVTPDDAALFAEMSDYMKGLLDTLDVKNDPAYRITSMATMEVVSDSGKKEHSIDNEMFIRDGFQRSEIKRMEREIAENNIDEITAGWVKEWQSSELRTHSAERREFIETAMAGDKGDDGRSAKRIVPNKPVKRSLIARYAILAAAVMAGAIFIFRTLLPSNNPDTLYKTWYEPFVPVAPVTRNAGAADQLNLAPAIESYKNGSYKTAAADFSRAMLKNPSSVQPRFYMGITLMALENYDRAIDLLDGVALGNSEFAKNAEWYLGLAYLKTGNSDRAKHCFETLARSSAYYAGPSEKILRRLK